MSIASESTLWSAHDEPTRPSIPHAVQRAAGGGRVRNPLHLLSERLHRLGDAGTVTYSVPVYSQYGARPYCRWSRGDTTVELTVDQTVTAIEVGAYLLLWALDDAGLP